MPREQNFLLGRGERLATQLRIPRGGSEKRPPYQLAEAIERLGPRVTEVANGVASLPPEACPRDEAVAVLTMHPRYLAKSDFPAHLMQVTGLRAIGSRSRIVAPEQWGVEAHGVTGVGEDLFVAGSRSAFENWAENLRSWTDLAPAPGLWQDLRNVEDVTVASPEAKIRGLISGDDDLLEVVLHNSDRSVIVGAFISYVVNLHAEPLVKSRHDVGGLTFLPVRAKGVSPVEIARFAFVRVARSMPRLRPIRPIARGGGFDTPISLPDAPAVSSSTRVVIFDGGIPAETRDSLKRWVTVTEPDDIGDPDPDYQQHGLAVTAAFLFGPLNVGSGLSAPLCNVEHVRVLDIHSDDANDPIAYTVLDRIVRHIDQASEPFDLVNISVGPQMAIDDDDVSLWTSRLDELLAPGTTVTTVAAGNDGELDAPSGLNRIQPPADGVNILSVGAADGTALGWARAAYSCVGPGRSPGIVKPDGLAFGGSLGTPFAVLNADCTIGFSEGTSYASPVALRSAAAVMVQLGDGVSALATRALLVHRAERTDTHSWREVGWGLFESDPTRLITCDDDEAVVLYQGYLPVSEHLRIPVAMPEQQMRGMVALSATLIISPDVDPEHPASYTRSGLEVSFRPNANRIGMNPSGVRRSHAHTRPFFNVGNLYGKAGAQLRADGHKWEPCLRTQIKVRASSLVGPLFDIYYHHRADGKRAANPQPIPFALIVGLKAPLVADLYAGVVRAHARVLEPIRPVNRLQVQT